MSSIKRLFQVSLLAATTLSLAITGPAFASSSPSAVVEGFFQTAGDQSCDLPADNCIADQLTGDLYGRNELTTVDYTTTNTHINYYDTTVITVTQGEYAGKVFTGEEHGKINVNNGNFHSCAELTATDNSGDQLTIHYDGYIDLANNHDSGEYTGEINTNKHCPTQL